MRARHGYAILLDGHSISSEVPRFFAGRLPDLNLGTADGASCAPAFQHAAALVLAGAAGFSSVVNGRFKGGYVTRHYGRAGRAASTRSSSRPRRRATWTSRRPYPWDREPARRRSSPLLERLWRRCSRPIPGVTMQRIFIASHRVEAYLLVDRLAHAGIKAHVFNEHMSSIVGEVPPDVAQPQVWLDDDADRARGRHVLRAYQEERNRTGTHRLREVRRGESRHVRALLEVRLVVAAVIAGKR